MESITYTDGNRVYTCEFGNHSIEVMFYGDTDQKMVEGEFIGNPCEKSIIRTYYQSGQQKSYVVREN